MRLKSENFTLFNKSEPWGYYPPEVEEKIKQYETTIRELREKMLEEKQIRMALMQKVEQLQDELREMHYQMSSLELPDATEAVEHSVLEDFKEYNSQPISYSSESNSDECVDSIDDDQPFIIVK